MRDHDESRVRIGRIFPDGLGVQRIAASAPAQAALESPQGANADRVGREASADRFGALAGLRSLKASPCLG